VFFKNGPDAVRLHLLCCYSDVYKIRDGFLYRTYADSKIGFGGLLGWAGDLIFFREQIIFFNILLHYGQYIYNLAFGLLAKIKVLGGAKFV